MSTSRKVYRYTGRYGYKNSGMGVSDLVMTPAYGAFGGAIQEGNYVGGPMHWMRRGIGNPGPGDPEPTFHRASYAKGKMLVRDPGVGGWKSRAGRLIDYLGGRYTHRERGYVMSPSAAGKLMRLWSMGYDVRALTKELIPPNKNPLVHGYSRKSFGKNVKRERGRGVSKKRALAIAFATGRRAAKRAKVKMPKFLRRNPTAPPPGYVVWRQSTDYLYGWQWRCGNVKGDGYRTRKAAITAAWHHAEGNKNPRYRQSPPGAPSLAASRASSWRSLTTSFPGASISSVTARGNPTKAWRALGVRKGSVVRWRGENWRVLGVTSQDMGSRRYADFLDVRNARGVRDLIPVDTFKHGGASVKKNPKRRNKNPSGVSFWRATIYSPTGKPIHRQVIQNTRAGAVASAKKLARTNPKVALDGPFKSKPAC